jgi:hypothetical protein
MGQVSYSVKVVGQAVVFQDQDVMVQWETNAKQPTNKEGVPQGFGYLHLFCENEQPNAIWSYSLGKQSSGIVSVPVGSLDLDCNKRYLVAWCPLGPRNYSSLMWLLGGNCYGPPYATTDRTIRILLPQYGLEAPTQFVAGGGGQLSTTWSVQGTVPEGHISIVHDGYTVERRKLHARQDQTQGVLSFTGTDLGHRKEYTFQWHDNTGNLLSESEPFTATILHSLITDATSEALAVFENNKRPRPPSGCATQEDRDFGSDVVERATKARKLQAAAA